MHVSKQPIQLYSSAAMKAYPAHAMQSWFRRAHISIGFLILSFGMGILSFRTDDTAALEGRSAFLITVPCLTAWVILCIGLAFRCRRLFVAEYGRVEPKHKGWLRYAHWIKLGLAYSCGAAWISMASFGRIMEGDPNVIEIEANWLLAPILFGGFAAALLQALLDKPENSEAFDLEEAQLAEMEVYQEKFRVRMRTESGIGGLSKHISRRITELQELRKQIEKDKKDQVANPEKLASAMRVFHNVLVQSSRSSLRQQRVSVAVSFILGFVVNWLSPPLLNLLQLSV